MTNPKKSRNRKSPRASWWDYRNQAAYFVTICTKNREHFFGTIKHGKMNLSHQGVMADIFWYQIKQRVPGIELGEWVVMPNHVHGIVIIGDDPGRDVFGRGVACNAPTENVPAKNVNQTMSSISPKPRSLSSIIRSYKSAVTMHYNRLGFPFAWQGRYHDHIIRDAESFERISNYICRNPEKWEEDVFREWPFIQ